MVANDYRILDAQRRDELEQLVLDLSLKPDDQLSDIERAFVDSATHSAGLHFRLENLNRIFISLQNMSDDLAQAPEGALVAATEVATAIHNAVQHAISYIEEKTDDFDASKKTDE